MITLYESILGSTKSGKYQLIKDWCEKYKPFNGNYKINSKGEIERNINSSVVHLYLPFKDYTELPSYIQFADDEDLIVFLGKDSRRGSSDIARNITSFRGIPRNVKRLSIFTNGKHLPDFEIYTQSCHIYASFANSFGKIIVNMKRGDLAGTLGSVFIVRDFGYGVKTWPKTIIVNNAHTIQMVNASDMGDNFSKLLNRKAPMNKYVHKYEFPVTEEGVKIIEDYFGNSVDLKTVKKIKYTQNSELVKYDNKWFRCKNRD